MSGPGSGFQKPEPGPKAWAWPLHSWPSQPRLTCRPLLLQASPARTAPPWLLHHPVSHAPPPHATCALGCHVTYHGPHTTSHSPCAMCHSPCATRLCPRARTAPWPSSSAPHAAPTCHTCRSGIQASNHVPLHPTVTFRPPADVPRPPRRCPGITHHNGKHSTFQRAHNLLP